MMKPYRNNAGFVTMILIGMLAAIIVTVTIRNQALSYSVQPEASGGSTIPPPQDIEDLLKRAEVVVVAKTANIVKQSTFSGYDKDGRVIQGKFPDLPNSDLPYTDFSLQIEQAIRSDDATEKGDPIILRMLGHPKQGEELTRDQQSSFPLSLIGERRLYFLSKNPDGTYGLYYGPWSRLNIDSVVTVSNGAKTPVQFEGTPTDAANFIKRVVELAPQIPIQLGQEVVSPLPEQNSSDIQERPTPSVP